MTNVSCSITRRTSTVGHPFTEILHTWTDGDIERFACSRVWWVIEDSQHSRAAQNAAFVERHRRWS